MQRKEELKTWRAAAIIVVLAAAFVFFIQFFVGRFFNDVILEICIFYIPAFASVMLYLYLRQKPGLSG
ncbi:MAG TPA: hypothetical protein VJ249_10910 [Candidatus Bathyarchaeia archaeon]|nr:hypothetical protein [Candidatus Bathyarchaeia archaeon]